MRFLRKRNLLGNFVHTVLGPCPNRWKVLAVKDGRALLISANILDSMPFNSDGAAGWEDLELHGFLVDKFHLIAFTEQEREMIGGGPLCLSLLPNAV